jgi:hypothetical protein
MDGWFLARSESAKRPIDSELARDRMRGAGRLGDRPTRGQTHGFRSVDHRNSISAVVDGAEFF